MCDEGRTNDRHQPGRATRIIHLLLVVLFFAPICAACVTAQSSTFWDTNYTSNNVTIYATPTPFPTVMPASLELSGLVLDAQGNKVPGAFVLLYRDGGTAPIGGNPMDTGSDAGSGYGEYNFTGLQPGEYTVYAQKSDIFLYNGTASISLAGDVDTCLNVVIKGYVAKPGPTQIPVQTPMPVFAAMTAPAVTALPANVTSNDVVGDMINKAKEKALGPLIGLFVIAIVGAGAMTLWDMLKPKNKGKTVKPEQPVAEKKAGEPIPQTKTVTQPTNSNTGYMVEITELAKAYDPKSPGDASALNRVNELSKKYGVDQGKIFTDIKKARNGKP